MAKKEMLLSECDRCGKTAMTETATFTKNERHLPNGWINVAIVGRKSDLITMDLCDECGVPVLKELHKI
jgi:hypothetical protein